MTKSQETKTPKAAKPSYDATSITDASTFEIKAFAAKEAGLVFDDGMSRAYMLEQLFEALQWLQKDPTDGATHVLMKIAISPESGGQHDVRLGHNGRMMTVQREKEVEVPIEFYNVLMDINSLGYTIPALNKTGSLKEETPLGNRVTITKYPVTVLRFINKGK
jgi:hypothetical protein